MPHTQEAIRPEELEDVKGAYRKLVRSMRTKLKDDDKDNIKKAYDLAVKAHMYQRRKSGEPYVLHPIEVARICHDEIGLGPTAIICAILHDVVEDTDVTLTEIDEMFGEKISKIVDGLTKLDGLYNVESPQAENLKKVLSTLLYDVRVVLIKMADRLHNLRTIGSMPHHKQIKIASETSYIYAPLAHRLGLYNIKSEFEDICMQITDADTYNDIKNQLDASEEERNEYIAQFIKPLKKKIKSLAIKFRVLGRPKSIASIFNKIKTKKVDFEQIYDLFAVRIIVDVPIDEEKTTCWQIYSLITDIYKPIPERLKDWVTTPKGNGYESLHTTVIGPKGRFVEVQIRSERMDDIAERGFAAHWKYKGVRNKENVYDLWLGNIREILEAHHSNALEFLTDFKSNLFSEEVYVFTPKGDMKILPKGATALDFAFYIHSDIGYHATAIKVNNKLVPMGYTLQNGDQLSVTTHKNQKPHEDWLKLVITGKAKSKIRSSMKEEKRKKGQLGKEALARKLKNMKAGFEENVDMLVKHFGFISRVDLYYAISIDEIKVSSLSKRFKVEKGILVEKLIEENTQKAKPDNEPASGPSRKEKKLAKQQQNLILVNGEPASQYNYSFANCCNPVHGDEIFAFLSTLGGLKIHRANCPNAVHLMANYGYRSLNAEWAGQSHRNFVVDLSVTGVDTGIGVIQTLITEISSKLNINIRSFNIEGKDGYFESKISLLIRNKDQLSIVRKALGKVEGVSRVQRIEEVD